MRTLAPYRLSIVGAAVLFSTGGAAIKGCALSGWQVASFRSAIAAVVLALLIPSARRNWSWRTVLVGLAYAATMILFVLGNKLTTAANTIFLQSTAPFYVLLFAPWLLKEQAKKSDFWLMAIIAGGLGLFFIDLDPVGQSAPRPLLGNLLSCIAGISWAFTLLGLRWLERSRELDAKGRSSSTGLSAVLVGNLLAAAIALPMALPINSGFVTSDWINILYLGSIQIGLAYVLLTYGFRRVPALEVSLLILIEPTLNPVWAWLFQGESPGGWAVLGGAVILLASIAKTWMEQHGRVARAAPK